MLSFFLCQIRKGPLFHQIRRKLSWDGGKTNLAINHCHCWHWWHLLHCLHCLHCSCIFFPTEKCGVAGKLIWPFIGTCALPKRMNFWKTSKLPYHCVSALFQIFRFYDRLEIYFFWEAVKKTVFLGIILARFRNKNVNFMAKNNGPPNQELFLKNSFFYCFPKSLIP